MRLSCFRHFFISLRQSLLPLSPLYCFFSLTIFLRRFPILRSASSSFASPAALPSPEAPCSNRISLATFLRHHPVSISTPSLPLPPPSSLPLHHHSLSTTTPSANSITAANATTAPGRAPAEEYVTDSPFPPLRYTSHALPPPSSRPFSPSPSSPPFSLDLPSPSTSLPPPPYSLFPLYLHYPLPPRLPLPPSVHPLPSPPFPSPPSPDSASKKTVLSSAGPL